MKRLAPTWMRPGPGRPGRRSVAPTVLVLGLVAGLALLGGCGKKDDNVSFPRPEATPPEPWYFDVFGTGADDVWVSGNAGMMQHWDGTAWTRVDMGTDQAINGVWGPNDGTLYACGNSGFLARRAAGGSWVRMNSGTSKDLRRLGSYEGEVHAVGADGAALRLSGGSWQQRPGFIVTRNPKEGNAVVDSLFLQEDVVTLLAVNHYMIGGAYYDQDVPEEDRVGTRGTIGFFIKDDTPIVDPDADPPVDETGLYDWLLTSVGNDPLAPPEWIYCTLSDDTEDGVSNNWFGTSSGWLHRLVKSVDTGEINWQRYSMLPVTTDARFGIRDLWLDAGGDLYIVTEDGLLVRQQPDGTREKLYDQLESLVSIWGTGPDNMYVTGYMDDTILHVAYDPAGGTPPEVTPIPLPFPAAKAAAPQREMDELGRPRF